MDAPASSRRYRFYVNKPGQRDEEKETSPRRSLLGSLEVWRDLDRWAWPPWAVWLPPGFIDIPPRWPYWASNGAERSLKCVKETRRPEETREDYTGLYLLNLCFKAQLEVKGHRRWETVSPASSPFIQPVIWTLWQLWGNEPWPHHTFFFTLHSMSFSRRFYPKRLTISAST